MERKGDIKDRRLIKINLTKEGKKVVDVAMEHRTNEMGKLLSYLSAADKKDLLRILKKITDKANAEKMQ